MQTHRPEITQILSLNGSEWSTKIVSDHFLHSFEKTFLNLSPAIFVYFTVISKTLWYRVKQGIVLLFIFQFSLILQSLLIIIFSTSWEQTLLWRWEKMPYSNIHWVTATLIMLHWQRTDSFSSVPTSKDATLQRNCGDRTEWKFSASHQSHPGRYQNLLYCNDIY